MKHLIIIAFSCCFNTAKAQSVISLEHAATYTGDSLFPATVNYVKDINHKLDPFIGIWKGSNAGWLYEVRFTKKTAWDFGLPGDGIKWDLLIGRVLVKDSLTNQVLYNTLDSTDDKTHFSGDNFGTPRVYNMYFGANSECYDWGDVAIVMHPTDTTKMTMFFDRNVEWVDPSTCPGGYANYKTMLPARMGLTKQ